MLPTKSNTADQGCSPVSSNCVIWQGPDLPCINLCNGDTVSSVVYKVATDLCTIKTALDLSALDLSCLVSFCTSVNPAPTTKTLPAVLDFIIDKVCCLNTKVDNLPAGGSSYTEPNITLPTCLQYNDPATGQPVTQLIHNQYSLRLGNQFCTLSATVASHTTTLATYNTRITALENSGGYVPPTVTPNCLLTPGTPVAMHTLLDEVEAQYCTLRTVLGTNQALTAGIAQQCLNLGASPALSTSGTVSSLTGWNSTVSNVGQSIQNLWVVLCDMRQTIYDIKNAAGQTDCSSFLLGFTAAANEARTQVTVFFNGGGTVVPSGFTNCTAQGSKITITDTSGHTYTDYVNLVTAVTDTDGITYTVSGASLNPSQTYTITVEGCLTKNGNTCSKTANYTVSVPCPIITSVTATLS